MQQVLGNPETAALILPYTGPSLASAILATPMFAQAIEPAMAQGDWLRCSYPPGECVEFSLKKMQDFEVALWLLDNLYDNTEARAHAATQALLLAMKMPELPVEHSVVEALVARGGDVNTQQVDGMSALVLATVRGDKELVLSLLTLGANVSIGYEKRLKPLHYAIWRGNEDVAELLLDAEADIGTRGSEPGVTLAIHLRTAVTAGSLGVAELLLERGANIEGATPDGFTPLLEAVNQGNKDMVDLLLRRGANTEAADDETDFRPLHLAVQMNHPEIVELLLNCGADVSAAIPEDGSTPLSIAEDLGNTEVANLLRSAAQHAQPGGHPGSM